MTTGIAPPNDQESALIETLPANSRVLAANEVSAIQAITVQTPSRGSFHGTQYHPEHTLAVSAALIELRAAELVEEGFGTTPSQIVAIAADYRALASEPPPRPDLALRGSERDHGSHSPDYRDRQLAADRRHTAPVLNFAAPTRPQSAGPANLRAGAQVCGAACQAKPTPSRPRSIADDRAALVTDPIAKAQIIDPHVVKSGAHRRRGTECGPAAAFAMRHDMIARAKPDPLQHRAQSRGRPHHAILHQVDVRQVPCPGQMAAAGTIARVLAGELRSRPRIEHMCPTVELIPQSLPVDQPDRP